MDNASVPPRRMPLHLLEEITHDFSKGRNIGAGSYGSVYRGEHKNGETIAVKLLHDIPGLDAEQFENEYHNLASLEHKNVVRLVGYCDETRREVLPFNGKMVFAEMTKRALCFEYMHNGSLEKYLSDEFNGHDWHTRYTIIKGICHGLKYRHEELQSPMYHLDLKPANVLLDDEHMVAKLADFGMARLYGGEKAQMTKSAIGTHGYVPPEYIDAAIISNKFDIFSLGVLIIKIMTGAKGYYRSAEMSSQEFIEHVHANWTKRLHAESLYLLDSYSEQVKRCIDIALSCLEGDRHKRPTIGLIVNKLNETETMSKMSSEEPDKPLESAVLSRLKQFSAMNELKKMALRVIAETLSEEETAGLKEMFKMMDTDNNGQISYEELKAELEWGGAKMKESEIYQLMKAAHIDNSGTIDYGEFIAATLNLNIVVEREEHLFAAFEYFDKDGSGYITTDELQQACDEFGIKDIRLEDMIGEVDQDNDGCIDYNEFVAMMQKSSPGVGKEGSPQS